MHSAIFEDGSGGPAAVITTSDACYAGAGGVGAGLRASVVACAADAVCAPWAGGSPSFEPQPTCRTIPPIRPVARVGSTDQPDRVLRGGESAARERERPGSPKEQPVHPLRRVQFARAACIGTDGGLPHGRSGAGCASGARVLLARPVPRWPRRLAPLGLRLSPVSGSSR